MSNWPKLSRAPIVEGLIDIRVERSSAVNVALLKNACDDLAEAFPSRQDQHMWMGQISLSPTAATISTGVNEPNGVILRSADQRWVAQFQLDGFTLSRLQPYGTWEDLRSKATELWTKYCAVTHPSKIVRVATRFINRIPLPPGESFERTFLTTFSISPDLPQAVANFLLRLVVPFEVEQAVGIVTQALDKNGAECIFDIDVFAENPEGFSQDQTWAKLDVLREIKNKLFFDSLTPEALERFR
jgi:uncharacterized protein (TIGR04255 family)